jgi:hypothetical protein
MAVAGAAGVPVAETRYLDTSGAATNQEPCELRAARSLGAPAIGARRVGEPRPAGERVDMTPAQAQREFTSSCPVWGHWQLFSPAEVDQSRPCGTPPLSPVQEAVDASMSGCFRRSRIPRQPSSHTSTPEWKRLSRGRAAVDGGVHNVGGHWPLSRADGARRMRSRRGVDSDEGDGAGDVVLVETATATSR